MLLTKKNIYIYIDQYETLACVKFEFNFHLNLFLPMFFLSNSEAVAMQADESKLISKLLSS